MERPGRWAGPHPMGATFCQLPLEGPDELTGHAPGAMKFGSPGATLITLR
jgi:hypothetical protein